MLTNELEFFKEILKDRKIQILKNIEGVHDELEELSRCELSDEGDYVSISNNAMVENAIGLQQQEELQAIDKALRKIASREYGTCEMCGDDIGFQRLKVKPHAIYCIHCREIIDKPTKQKWGNASL
ncbi:MAG: RNA polymerase-binding protein DksA [Epsilonproteobacteria bacterium]|nr:RNA polymerase-binding protein DksA [Campylobacterota bacterium]